MYNGSSNLTPVEYTNGIYFKRDDLFSPFGDVNGGKFRQCYYLVQKKIGSTRSLITACGIHSPQAPIVASIANYYSIPSTVLYGGTTEQRLNELPMPVLARKYGAKILNFKTGRHNVLYAKAREIAQKESNSFIIEYAFNCSDNIKEFFESTAYQVKNIPDELGNLIITCGSGITTSGILLGIVKYNKKVKNIYIVGIAPNREIQIRKRLIQLSEYSDLDLRAVKFNYIDLQKMAKRVFKSASVGNIILHSHYEAIAYRWFENRDFKGDTLFWIIGKEC
jgi:1-aminocyclopropane-1-carboxylate deaminase/D-cysteine desulfhydrase-like pyridoxal-dependent ACC family enzyme